MRRFGLKEERDPSVLQHTAQLVRTDFEDYCERLGKELFGKEGFIQTADKVAVIERKLGTSEPDQFTPGLSARP